MDDDSSAFLDGWRSLPDELELNILAYVLPSTINSEEISGAFYQYGLQAEMEIRSLLLCPEIIGLVSEAFYSRSFVEVCDVSSADVLGIKPKEISSSCNFELPPVAFRHYIRHLSVNIERLRPDSFSALSRLSTAIPALQQLDVKIQEFPDHISRTPVVRLHCTTH
jgi:hypothetical protein